MKLAFASGILYLLAIVGCQSSDSSSEGGATTPPSIPDSAQKVQPLGEGDKAPNAALRRPDGQEVNLADLYAAKPTVLIFYRGGWCPYCSTHLGQIATVEAKLLSMGYQVLAVSPDRPEELRKTMDKQNLTYQLLSDSDMALSQSFGIAFRVDDPTLEKYRGFGIDLVQSSGRSHHLLPVPAVYIVDTRAVIRFAHWDPDYKRRLDPEKLLSAARKAQRSSGLPAKAQE
jgi:peroxiredoxin